MAAASLASGCAYLTHYNYKRDGVAGAGEAIYSDAKQRAILAVPREDQKIALMRELREGALERSRDQWRDAQKIKEKIRTETNTAKAAELEALYKELIKREEYQRNFASQLGSRILSGDVGGADMRLVAFCAEPSPDALSALSASGAIKIDTPKGFSGATQGAFAETAGSIGLRTQSIQLMRDAMYRLCEGAMNGYLGNAAFETLHRRFQNSMVAILAVEQLTGAVRAPALTLNSGAAVGPPAKQMADMTDRVITARGDVRKAESDKTSADEELDKADTKLKEAKDDKTAADNAHKKALAENEATEEGKPKPHDEAALTNLKTALDKADGDLETATSTQEAADKKVKDAEKNLADRQATLADLERGLNDMRLGKAEAFAYGRIERGWLEDGHYARGMRRVAKAVETIVTDFYDQGYVQEVCTTIFTSMVDGEIDERTFDEFAEQFQIPNKEKNGAKSFENRETTVPQLCLDHIALTAEAEIKKAREDIKRIKKDTEFAEREYKFKIDNAEQKLATENEKIDIAVKTLEGIFEETKIEATKINKQVTLLTEWMDENSKNYDEICNPNNVNSAKTKFGSEFPTQYAECKAFIEELWNIHQGKKPSVNIHRALQKVENTIGSFN